MVEIPALEMFKTGHEKTSPENVCGDQMDEMTLIFFFFPSLTLWKTSHPSHSQTVFQCQLGPKNTTEAGLGTGQSLEILLQWFPPE